MTRLYLTCVHFVTEGKPTRHGDLAGGWAALPEHATDGFATKGAARSFLYRAADADDRDVTFTDAELFRNASRRHHPDKGGTTDMMMKINAARKVLA